MTNELTDDPIATPIPKEVPQLDAPFEEPESSLPIEMMEDKPDKDDLFEDGNFPLCSRVNPIFEDCIPA